MFPRHLKLLIVIFFAGALIVFVWFSLLCSKIIPFSTGMQTIYVIVVHEKCFRYLNFI